MRGASSLVAYIRYDSQYMMLFTTDITLHAVGTTDHISRQSTHFRVNRAPEHLQIINYPTARRTHHKHVTNANAADAARDTNLPPFRRVRKEARGKGGRWRGVGGHGGRGEGREHTAKLQHKRYRDRQHQQERRRPPRRRHRRRRGNRRKKM